MENTEYKMQSLEKRKRKKKINEKWQSVACNRTEKKYEKKNSEKFLKTM